MNMQTALASFGVTDSTLSADEKRQLDEQGFLPLPSVLSTAQAEALRIRFQELMRMRKAMRRVWKCIRRPVPSGLPTW